MAKKQYNPVEHIGSVIFRFISKKNNLIHKLVSKSVDPRSGEIIEGEALISEEQALKFNKKFGWKIKEYNKPEDVEGLSYADYLKQEAELDARLAEKEKEKE